MRLSLALALGLLPLSAPERELNRAASPPNSFEPKPASATVHIRHEHRVVRSCSVQGQRSDLRCSAVLDIGDATTTLQLVPLKTKRLQNQPDAREPVTVHIGSKGVSEGGPIGVGAGAWDIAWPGYPRRKAFTLEAGRIASVTLETTTGRCEKVAQQCTFVAAAVVKRIETSVR